MLESTKATPQGANMLGAPCSITSLDPLEVSLNGGTVRGVPIPGVYYTIGPAYAVWAPPAQPLIFPTGA